MTRPLMVAGLLLLFVSFACAADNLSFSVMTSTGKIPVNPMGSYKFIEHGDFSGHGDLMYLCSENAFALGVSARYDKLDRIIPLVKGGGLCGYWSFRHKCIKGRFYIVNVSF